MSEVSSYEFSSDGIKILGDDSFHVMKIMDKDEWILVRLRSGTTYKSATFASPDEARAFAHSLGLTLNRVKN
jgi:hypothetical protein